MKLLENGQLEILAGGWVMNDEANTFYWAMIEQMVFGHEWLDLNLNGYKPKYVDKDGCTVVFPQIILRKFIFIVNQIFCSKLLNWKLW